MTASSSALSTAQNRERACGGRRLRRTLVVLSGRLTLDWRDARNHARKEGARLRPARDGVASLGGTNALRRFRGSPLRACSETSAGSGTRRGLGGHATTGSDPAGALAGTNVAANATST